MSVTLADLITRVRQRADQERSQFVTDGEITTYINGSYAELYDLLVGKFEDYFTITSPQTVSGGLGQIPLPSDFYKLRGLDYSLSGTSDWVTVPRFNFAERNTKSRATSRIFSGQQNLSYNILGQMIQLLPASSADGSYQLWYVPRVAPLVNTTDVISGVLDFEEYVVVDGAIKCIIKEESDPTALMKAKADLVQRINAMAAQRDAGGTGRVGDAQMSGDHLEDFFPY